MGGLFGGGMTAMVRVPSPDEIAAQARQNAAFQAKLNAAYNAQAQMIQAPVMTPAPAVPPAHRIIHKDELAYIIKQADQAKAEADTARTIVEMVIADQDRVLDFIIQIAQDSDPWIKHKIRLWLSLNFPMAVDRFMEATAEKKEMDPPF